MDKRPTTRSQRILREVAHSEQFTGRFCAAARALLDWSQDRLASEAGVARKTVSDFELSLRQPHARTKKDLLATFAQHGVHFAISLEGCCLSMSANPGDTQAGDT